MDGASDEENDGKRGKRGKLREMNPVDMFREAIFGTTITEAAPIVAEAAAVTADWLRETGLREPVLVSSAPNVVRNTLENGSLKGGLRCYSPCWAAG
jgi:hypothetical protein